MNKEPVVIPPGIVAFKNWANQIVRLDDYAPFGKHRTYEDFVKTHLTEDNPSTIHTIEVEGRQWSVDEWIIFRGRQEQITSFEFSEGHQWKVKLKAFDEDLRFAIQTITKIPQPQPSEQPEEKKALDLIKKFYDLYYELGADWDDEWIVLFEEAKELLTGEKTDPNESDTQPAYKGLLARKDGEIQLLADMIIEILADIRRKPNDTRYATVVKKATELLFKLKCGLDPVPKS